MQRKFSVQCLLVCCVCLLDIWRWWLICCYSVCFLLGWVLQLSPLADHVARTSRGARRERSGQWAVGSFYWSEVWLLLVVHTQLSWLVHHSSALGDTLCSWPSPGHRPHSHNIHSAVSNPGQIPVQGIYNNMQIRLAHCICIHYSLTCITSTNRFSFMKI